MDKEARKLGNDEFRQITAQKLENDRVFVRDVHYTIEESGRDKGSIIPSMMIEVEIDRESPDGKWSGTTFVKAFPISDDPEHIFFFELGWPCYHDEFLDPKDIIPSGSFTLNASKKNKERVLEILKSEKAGTEMMEISKDGLNEFFKSAVGDEEAMKKKIEDSKVQVPINSMEMLDWAIYGCDQHVFNLLGSNPIMFTKELKRTDGKVVERYNNKLNAWEVISGKPKFDTSRRFKKQIIFICTALSLLSVLGACFVLAEYADMKIGHLISIVLGSFGLSLIISRFRRRKSQ